MVFGIYDDFCFHLVTCQPLIGLLMTFSFNLKQYNNKRLKGLNAHQSMIHLQCINLNIIYGSQ